MYKSGHNPKQSHNNGEVGFLHWCGGWSRGQTLAVLEGRREEFNDQRTHSLLQHEAELLVLRTQTIQLDHQQTSHSHHKIW